MIPPLTSIPGLTSGELKLGGLGTSVPTAVGPQALSAGTSASGAVQPSSGASFGDALTKALGSLESTQATATQASQQLATGQLTNPTTAITDVENASLSMDFASQIRNQIDTAANTIFQTQL